MKDRYENLDEYIADLRAALSQNDGCANHHYNLGVALLSKGDFVAAEESFLAAVRNSSHLAEAYVQLGGICLQRGDLEGCLRYNEEAANCRAKFPVPWSNIGFAAACSAARCAARARTCSRSATASSAAAPGSVTAAERTAGRTRGIAGAFRRRTQLARVRCTRCRGRPPRRTQARDGRGAIPLRHPSCVRVGFVGVVWLRARRGMVTKRQRRSSRPYECPANRHTRFKNPSQELGGQTAFRVGAPHAKHPLRSAVPLPSPDPGRAYGRRGTMMQNTNRAVGTAREQERAYVRAADSHGG